MNTPVGFGTRTAPPTPTTTPYNENPSPDYCRGRDLRILSMEPPMDRHTIPPLEARNQDLSPDSHQGSTTPVLVAPQESGAQATDERWAGRYRPGHIGGRTSADYAPATPPEQGHPKWYLTLRGDGLTAAQKNWGSRRHVLQVAAQIAIDPRLTEPARITGLVYCAIAYQRGIREGFIPEESVATYPQYPHSKATVWKSKMALRRLGYLVHTGTGPARDAQSRGAHRHRLDLALPARYQITPDRHRDPVDLRIRANALRMIGLRVSLGHLTTTEARVIRRHLHGYSPETWARHHVTLDRARDILWRFQRCQTWRPFRSGNAAQSIAYHEATRPTRLKAWQDRMDHDRDRPTAFSIGGLTREADADGHATWGFWEILDDRPTYEGLEDWHLEGHEIPPAGEWAPEDAQITRHTDGTCTATWTFDVTVTTGGWTTVRKPVDVNRGWGEPIWRTHSVPVYRPTHTVTTTYQQSRAVRYRQAIWIWDEGLVTTGYWRHGTHWIDTSPPPSPPPDPPDGLVDDF